MSQDSDWSKEGYGLRTATCLKTVAGVRKAMVSEPLHVQNSGWSKEGYGLCQVAGPVSGPLHVSRQWLE